MKHLEQLFKMKRMLEFHAKHTYGHQYKCETKLAGFEEASTRIEDGKPYHYPALFDVIIENWNTWKGNFRPQDGVWLREGRDLNGPGLTTPQMYRRMLKELKRHRELINAKQ